MNMKLTRIAIHEPSVKNSFTFKQSTADMLERYRQAYSKMVGSDVKMSAMVEQMLLDFMSADKTFQKVLRTGEPAEKATPATPAATVQASTPPAVESNQAI